MGSTQTDIWDRSDIGNDPIDNPQAGRAAIGAVIYDTEFTGFEYLRDVVNTEITRRNNLSTAGHNFWSHSSPDPTLPFTLGLITVDDDFNTMIDAVNLMVTSNNAAVATGRGQTSPTNISSNAIVDNVSGIIDAVTFNKLVDSINVINRTCMCNSNRCTCNCNYCTCNCNYCTCNCNYCTCNCNYCTCNCNHACTCNCNYSDERLKINIQYL